MHNDFIRKDRWNRFVFIYCGQISLCLTQKTNNGSYQKCVWNIVFTHKTHVQKEMESWVRFQKVTDVRHSVVVYESLQGDSEKPPQ